MKLLNRDFKNENFIGFMLILFFFIGFTLNSCEKYSFDPPQIDPELVISYADDIQTIFANKCTSCHGVDFHQI
jgi:mono/diheme cytochrome c family protein